MSTEKLHKFEVDGLIPTVQNGAVIPQFPNKPRTVYIKHGKLTKEEAQELRRKQNREAARRMRKKKAQQRAFLEQKIDLLNHEMSGINDENHKNKLKKQLEEIKISRKEIIAIQNRSSQNKKRIRKRKLKIDEDVKNINHTTCDTQTSNEHEQPLKKRLKLNPTLTTASNIAQMNHNVKLNNPITSNPFPTMQFVQIPTIINFSPSNFPRPQALNIINNNKKSSFLPNLMMNNAHSKQLQDDNKKKDNRTNEAKPHVPALKTPSPMMFTYHSPSELATSPMWLISPFKVNNFPSPMFQMSPGFVINNDRNLNHPK